MGHYMSMSKENRHAMLFLARYILVIDLLTLSIWIILKEPCTYPFIGSDRFEESAKSNIVRYIQLHHKRNCHLKWLVLHHIMAKEESLPVGIWNIAFCTEKIVHACVHFLRNRKSHIFKNIWIDLYWTFYCTNQYDKDKST